MTSQEWLDKGYFRDYADSKVAIPENGLLRKYFSMLKSDMKKRENWKLEDGKAVFCDNDWERLQKMFPSDDQITSWLETLPDGVLQWPSHISI